MIRLLLVEDDGAQVELTRATMRQIKLLNQLEVARSGEAALKLLLEGSAAGRALPQLVLLDLNLPGMNGLELLEQLKKHEHTRTMPVVVLSAMQPDDHECAILKRHDTPWLLKPLSSASDFLAIVRLIEPLGFALVSRERD